MRYRGAEYADTNIDMPIAHAWPTMVLSTLATNLSSIAMMHASVAPDLNSVSPRSFRSSLYPHFLEKTAAMAASARALCCSMSAIASTAMRAQSYSTDTKYQLDAVHGLHCLFRVQKSTAIWQPCKQDTEISSSSTAAFVSQSSHIAPVMPQHCR